MMKNNMYPRGLVLAGAMALLLTGCGNSPGDNGAPTTEQISSKEVSVENTSAMQSQTANADEVQLKTGTENEDSSKPQENSTLVAGTDLEDDGLAQATAEALKKYFGITADPSEYQVKITHFEESENTLAQYFVEFLAPENEKLQMQKNSIEQQLAPEFSAVFSGTKELKGIVTRYIKWEAADQPADSDAVKKISKDFLTQNQLAEDKDIKFIQLNDISKTSSAVFYQIGTDDAIIMCVDTASGKVTQFQFTTLKQLEVLLAPRNE